MSRYIERNESCEYITAFAFPGSGFAIDLPQEPGMYLWFLLDLSYFEVGSVVVRKPSEAELADLRSREGVFVYTADDGSTLAMWHDENRRPACDPNTHCPFVDGYVQFTWDVINHNNERWPECAAKARGIERLSIAELAAFNKRRAPLEELKRRFAAKPEGASDEP